MTSSNAVLGDLLTDIRPGFASGDDLAEGTFQIRMNNLSQSGELLLDKRRRVSPDAKQIPRTLLEPGDVLFNTTNSPELVGKTAFFSGCDEPTVFSNHFIRLRTHEDRLDPRYLTRWLQREFQRGYFRAKAKQWVNQATFSQDRLIQMQVPLPPLSEQRRIAGVLDAAEALRAKRRQALCELDSLTRAVFVEMFGVGEETRKPLGQLAEVQSGLQVTSKRKGHPVEVPYLRVANVYRGSLDLGEIKTIRVFERELERTRLVRDDLLVVEGHGNKDEIGRVGLWDGSIDPCVHQNHLIRVRCDQNLLHPRFAETFMNSWIGRRALLRAANTTSGLNTISTKDVRDVQIPLPALSEQQRFVELANHVDRQRDTMKSSETELDALFASLQQRAFRGEL